MPSGYQIPRVQFSGRTCPPLRAHYYVEGSPFANGDGGMKEPRAK